MSKYYYGTVQKSLEGRFAIQIELEYPFWGSGVILPPVIQVMLWGMHPVEFVLNTGQQELAKAFGVKQQSVSRYLEKGTVIQELVSAGSLTEKDIWGYSPTQERLKQYEADDFQGTSTKSLPNHQLKRKLGQP